MKTRLLPLLVAAALSAGAAQASEPAKPTAQQQAARAEIDRLVQRIEELSRQLGEGNDVKVVVRRMERDKDGNVMIKRMGPGGMDDEDVMMVDRLPGGEGPRRIRIERHGPGGMMDEDGIERDVRIERIGPDGKKHFFGSGAGVGIVMSPNTAAAGVKIAAVTPESPAQKADLRAGDVLLAINGKPVGSGGTDAVDRARELLGDLKKGQVVDLRIARQGKTLDKKVTVDEIGRVWMVNRGEGMPGRDGMWHGEMHPRAMMLPPKVAMEIERVGPRGDCKKGGEDCGMPAIFQAFRWQGLNLASLDAGLGRYFGTDKGVLVVNAGPEMKGLQSGDVIQRVGGTAVDSPRDVMRALRDKDEGTQLKLDVLRDRKPVAATLTVPKSRPLPFMDVPAPPAPPAPPAAPRAPGVPAMPGMAPPAPPAAPAAPPPPPRPAAMEWEDEDGAQVVETRSVDADGAERVEVVVTAPRRG